MSHITVAIPTYEMRGKGVEYLRHSFDILTRQTFRDFDVVISDHSKDDGIKNLCTEFSDRLTINYFRNESGIGSSSANLNNAIRNSTGTLIKILFQDDFLYDEQSLERIANAFDIEKDAWLVTACEHSNDGTTFYRAFFPKYSEDIHLGNNTISSPSVLTIKNEGPLLFDDKLIWLMDCDYYKRCFDAFGLPKIVNDICVVNRTGDHQVSNTLATRALKEGEHSYVADKFAVRKKPKVKLPNVTLVAVSSVHLPKTVFALEHSMKDIEFARVLLVTHEKPDGLRPDITFVPCERITSLDAYSKYMLYDLDQHIDTEYALIVQHDGYVVRPYKWNDEFLKYDYIGAPWRHGAHFTKDGTPVLVGNGGFSLRSKKMISAFNDLKLPFTDGGTGFYNEDGVICNYYRKELEQAGIKFADPDVAARFSLEDKSFSRSIKPFGFHRNKRFVPFLHHLKTLFS